MKSDAVGGDLPGRSQAPIAPYPNDIVEGDEVYLTAFAQICPVVG